MEGVYPNDPECNLIYAQVSAAYLISALVSSKKVVNHIEIKLGKTDFPFFTIELKVLSAADQTLTISNTVPLIIIPKIGWEDFLLPYGEEFDVQIKLPRFAIFRKYIDTFKYSQKVRFTSREDQTLAIEADQEQARHFTIFKARVTNYDEGNLPYEGRAISALVEQKKIAHWLHSLSLSSSFQLMCMIKSSKLFQFSLKVREDLLGSFAMPAEFDDDGSDSDCSVEH